MAGVAESPPPSPVLCPPGVRLASLRPVPHPSHRVGVTCPPPRHKTRLYLGHSTAQQGPPRHLLSLWAGQALCCPGGSWSGSPEEQNQPETDRLTNSQELGADTSRDGRQPWLSRLCAAHRGCIHQAQDQDQCHPPEAASVRPETRGGAISAQLRSRRKTIPRIKGGQGRHEEFP